MPGFDSSPICCAEMVGHGKKVGMFPECIAKGSHFTLGVWGLRRVRPLLLFMFAAVRNRPQPSADVRSEGNMAVPLATFSVAGAALWRPPSSFCVAGVGHRESVILCGKRQAQHVVNLRRVWNCYVAWQARYLGHFTLYTPTLHSTLYTSHFTIHTIFFTLHTLHFTLYTPHSTLHTLHFTQSSLHSTLYTLHFTLHTPHLTLDTLHITFTLYAAPTGLQFFERASYRETNIRIDKQARTHTHNVFTFFTTDIPYHSVPYHTVPYRTIHKHYTYTHVCCFSLGQVPPPGLGGYRCPCPRAGHQVQWTGGQLRRRQKQGWHLRRGSFLFFFGFPASPLLHLFAFPAFPSFSAFLLLSFFASALFCFSAFLRFPDFFSFSRLNKR